MPPVYKGITAKQMPGFELFENDPRFSAKIRVQFMGGLNSSKER
jgi:hypothetical protein